MYLSLFFWLNELHYIQVCITLKKNKDIYKDVMKAPMQKYMQHICKGDKLYTHAKLCRNTLVLKENAFSTVSLTTL